MKCLPFVRQVSSAFLDKLESLAASKKLALGSILFLDGEIADQVFLIEQGRVKLTKTTLDGKELTLQVFGPGELVGFSGLFESSLTYTMTACMLEAGSVRIIPRSSLEKLLIDQSELCVEFMRWMGVTNRRMQSKFRDLLLNGKIGALYSTLIRMCNTYGKPQQEGILINLSLTNRDLAQFIGLTRESVNRMLAELKRLGVIEMMPQSCILVKDLDYLKKAICCDNCPPEICQM